MNLGVAFLDQVRAESPWTAEELARLEAAITMGWQKDHNPDGSHNIVRAAGAVFERARTTAIGDTITPFFVPTDFTANGTMTWTVTAAQVSNLSYYKVGSRMVLDFQIIASTVAGVANNRLRIAIPEGLFAARGILNPCRVIDNGVITTGFATVATADRVISIGRNDNANFAVGGGATTSVQGQIDFETRTA